MTPRQEVHLRAKAGYVDTAKRYIAAAAHHRTHGQPGKAAAKLKLAASYRCLAAFATHKADEAEYFGV